MRNEPKPTPYDSVTVVAEPGCFRLSLATVSMSGTSRDELIRKFEDLLRGHGYFFEGSLELVDDDYSLKPYEGEDE